MTKRLVLIPVVRDGLAAIDGSVLLASQAAHHMTPKLLAALGYAAGQERDAEYAALVLAPVAALTRFRERLVLMVDVGTSLIASGDGPENDAYVLTRIAPEAMTCWFNEALGVDVSAAAIAVRGLDIDAAWGFDEVQELLHESDLLWNDVEEYHRGLRW